MDNLEKHLVFKVQDQIFTVNVLNVNAIIQLPRIYKVPQAPDYIIGVVNVEGDVIPLIDSGLKLNMGKLAFNDLSQLIIMQRIVQTNDKFQRLGFLVSDVLDVIDINRLEIQTLPTSKFHFDERMVNGMHKVQDDFCMEINVDNFFEDEIKELITSI